MPTIPRTRTVDSTIPLLNEGYTFISRRCDALQSDIFRTRLTLRRAICVRGAAAAEMFYHPNRFTRRGAMPPTTLRLLQDRGSVQLLDGDAHRYRKAMFMAMMSPEQIHRLEDLVDDEWRSHLPSWQARDEITLLKEARDILCRAACRCAGIPINDAEVAQRTRELAAMIDNAGTAGPRNWWAQLLRRRTVQWAAAVIAHARADQSISAASTPLIIAIHRDCDGRPLDRDIAAVELINVLRPIVAVARYIAFIGVALYRYPDYRDYVRNGDNGDLEYFVHEVRRLYPFFPFIGGKALKPFDWQGHHFTTGTWVLLDVYGTNHDPRIWGDPQVFRPDRFADWDGSAFNFIPQGGGDHFSTQRCPGEWITIALMQHAARFLTTEMTYGVPAQDLTIRMSTMPAQPNSGFVMSNVRGRAGQD